MLREWESGGRYRASASTWPAGGSSRCWMARRMPTGRSISGHAYNKVLKDMIVKSKILDGYDAPYVPGWDCHGLPIEVRVERELGHEAAAIDGAAFRQACRRYAASQVEGQREAFRRLGVLGEWERPYLTMATRYEANQIRAFAEISRAGTFIAAKSRPLVFGLLLALAEAEVEYEDKTSTAVDVRFPVNDPGDFMPAFRAWRKAPRRFTSRSGPPRRGHCRPTAPWCSAILSTTLSWKRKSAGESSGWCWRAGSPTALSSATALLARASWRRSRASSWPASACGTPSTIAWRLC